MKHSEEIISALENNARQLLETHFIESWSYYAPGKPLKIGLVHEIEPQPDGSYKLRSKVSFGIRLAYRQDVDLNVPQQQEQASRFSRGIGLVSADAAA
jgi:hypothetical protein